MIGYEPEHILNFLESEKEIYKPYMPPLSEKITDKERMEVDVKHEQLNRFKTELPKRNQKLVIGFNGYLMRFESLLQKIAGSDMFLPENLRRETNRKAYLETK